MEHHLKSISKNGIPAAILKVQHYRNLNEPEEAESICRDVLAVDPNHQVALRLLGMAITDQFSGEPSDRYHEAQEVLERLTDPYERHYYLGIAHERRAKSQLQAGDIPRNLLVVFEAAMKCFEQAEKIRPADNDESLLRWNRCVRLLQSRPEFFEEREIRAFEGLDGPLPGTRK